MRIQVNKVHRFNPEHPRYSWRVWERGRVIRWGTAPSRQEAREMAAAELRARSDARQKVRKP